ncbi:MAG TPA: glycosyltransferase [Planctomycetota bacterium]|nr:glycosyltransferase [Planctomycetota bacterium]
MSPKLSVVLPCYNHEAYVERALRSVLEQGLDDLELVVVDDGSTDGTRDEIRRVLADAGSTRAIFHEQANGGSHAAIARGLELATGDVIALLNSDDEDAPGRLTRALAQAPAGGDFLLFTGVEMVDGTGRALAPRDDLARWYQLALRQSTSCPTVGYALLCNNIAVTSGNLVFSRGLAARAGGFAPWRFCPDWAFVLRCTRLVEPIFVPEPLYRYRVHEANTIDQAEVRDIDAEYGRFAGEYLRACADDAPRNPLAPCAANWPWYFPYFARTRRRFDSRLLAELYDDAALCPWPEPPAQAWSPWAGGVLALHARDDLGRLVSAAGTGDLPAHEGQALLRELALVRLGVHRRWPEFAPPGVSELELAREWVRATR